MSYLYDERTITTSQLHQLIEMASQFHKSTPVEYPKNMELRLLNHEHIFGTTFSFAPLHLTEKSFVLNGN